MTATSNYGSIYNDSNCSTYFDRRYEQLAELDANGDGKITRADILWSELKIWQDADGDGVTDAGELKTLDQLGIVSLDLSAKAIDTHTPQGARLTAVSRIPKRRYAADVCSQDMPMGVIAGGGGQQCVRAAANTLGFSEHNRSSIFEILLI